MSPSLSIRPQPPVLREDGSLHLGFDLSEDEGGMTLNFVMRGKGLQVPHHQAEAAAALALVPAMKKGQSLTVEGAFVEGLESQIGRFQEIFSCWYPEFQNITVSATGGARAADTKPVAGAAVFFSGGVDSLFTLLKHQEEITHAIFVHGCDIPLERESHRAMVSERLKEACREFRLVLIEVETNLLAFSDPKAHWGYHYHGSALAAIAMMASASFGKVFIGSTAMWRDLYPWGSHPLTDPLWSIPELEIVHDGCEARRVDKLQLLSTDDRALRHLRVCWENEEDAYNCGRCEKCLRTMVGLRLVGALDRCPVFAVPLDLEVVRMLRFPRGSHHWEDMLQRAEVAGDDAELADAMRVAVRRNAYADAVKEFARHNREIIESPQWQVLLPKIRNKLYQNLLEHDPEWFWGRISKTSESDRQHIFDRLWKTDRRAVWRAFWQAWRERWKRKLMGRRNADHKSD